MAPQPRGSAFPSTGRYSLYSTDEPWSRQPAANGREFLVYLRNQDQRIRLCGLIPDADYEFQWTSALDATVKTRVFEFRQKPGTNCRTFTNQAAFSRVVRVSLISKPPRAVIAAQPRGLSGAAPFSVTFDGSHSSDPDGSIASWEWTFPGGGAVGPAARYVFDSPGSWPVTLTVTDNDGLAGTVRVTVEVE